MSDTKTYTFTEEELLAVIEDAVDIRDHEVAMNPVLGKPVRTPAVFADEYAKTLGGTFNKEEKQMDNPETYTFTREQLHQAFLSAVIRRSDEIMRENQGCENAWIGRVSTFEKFAEDAVNRLVGAPTAPKSEVKETVTAEPKDEEEPKFEDDEDEPKGYISSRPVDKLQFNIDTLKLGNLPGCYKMVKEEGGFFKALSNLWNSGDWFENEVSMGEDDTPASFLDDMHYCSDTFWVNPKYANIKASDLGEIGSREVAMDGTTAISIIVYSKKDDGTVIAYDLNAC